MFWFKFQQLFTQNWRSNLLPVAKLQTVASDVDKKTVKSFTFLGKEVGRVCLCSVLGIGINRLRKALDAQPDLRVGAQKGGQRQAAYSVDAFLAVLYEGVAETLPDRFVRRGRAASRDDEDFDVASDCDLEDLKDWMDRPGQGAAWQCLNSSGKKICKYLPPGTVADLYEHYQATRHLFGAAVVSHPCCKRIFNLWKLQLVFLPLYAGPSVYHT